LLDGNFIVDLIESTPTHDQWLYVMRFGIKTLESNQPLLAKLLVSEAIREAERSPLNHVITPADQISRILEELRLKLSLI